ncbi:MAG TPA: DUF2306 domain-containing protein [Parvularculaceae bacterium]|nr:DUF2306 domain-containing protein [Parvularculaceae bacterium]HNS86681.1 DUF2306 domain-containing protein [Parvularculaceae bacterium]
MGDYLFTWANDPLGYAHLGIALSALLVGAIVVFMRKGTRVHVFAGYVYVASMLGVNASALLKYDLTGGPNLFHAAALFSLATLIAGYLAARRFRRTRRVGDAAAHGALMIWSYYGLVVALVAETFTRAVPFMLHGEGGWIRFSAALGIFMLATGLLTDRLIRREIARALRR